MSFPNRATGNASKASSTEGVPPINDDLMRLYNRIKDLYVQLGKERNILQSAQRQLTELQQIEQKEQKTNDQYRRCLLKCVNARNNVELELFAVQDQIEASKEAITKYDQERDDLESKLQEVQKESKSQTDIMYGPQQLKMNLYLRALSDIVQTKKQKIQKRNDRLSTIRVECEALKAQEMTAKKMAEQAQEEMVRRMSEGAHCELDEETSVLRGRIQKVLDERSRLRNELKLAQDENTKANEELLEWEEKRINFSNNQK
ncbi:hypothetical protein IV203_007413 [Nitzschia inconspicua]|uniref:Uncharacterized protein n=1 Tax=Nitzschia inconspicua TaxID=303405 RepID=A0A9K3KET3_9STRA|nr:hypothetical protein IV203_007413 [Nitzschia inconspicua]